MKLISLYASNFKKLKLDEPLDFKDGITVISGLNESGKSTILDAILYSLYGKVMRPSIHAKNEDIVSYGANSARVILEFEVSGKRYKVKREVFRNRPNTAALDEVLSDGKLKPTATKIKDVTSAIEELVGGITFNEIISSNIIAQKDMDRLIRAGSERKEVINAFLNIESFNIVLRNFNEERKEIEGTGPSRPGRLNVEKEKLDRFLSDFKEFQKRRDEIQGLKASLERLRRELSELESVYRKLEELYEALSAYDRTFTLEEQLKTQLNGKREVLRSHEENVGSLEGQLRQLEGELRRYEDLPDEEAVARVQALLEGLGRLGQEESSLKERLEKLRPEAKVLEGELAGFDIKELERVRREKISHRTLALGGAGITASIVVGLLIPQILAFTAVAVLAILLISLMMDLKRISKLTRMEGLLGRAEVLGAKKEEVSTLEGDLRGLSKKSEDLISSLTKAVHELSHYEPLVKEEMNPKAAGELLTSQYLKDKEKRASISSTVESLTLGLEKTKKRIDLQKLHSEIGELEQKVAGMEFPSLPQGLAFSKELVMDVSKKKEGRKGDVERCKANIEGTVERIEENRRYIEGNKDIEERVRSQERLVEELQHGLSVIREAIGGIEKTAETLRNRVKPNVEKYMGHILPSVTSGKYKAVMIDEEFRFQVWEPEAGEFKPKEVFSGGTEDQFLVAMRLAFALALMPELKGTKPDFLFLDEPLGSSDEVRRSGIMDYLTNRLSKEFSQIFIISHVGGLEDLVSNVMRLEEGRVVSQ